MDSGFAGCVRAPDDETLAPPLQSRLRGAGHRVRLAMTVRPRRSVLYMPASNPRALEKARELAADGLILDLEDAVAPEAKPQAREAVVKALQRGFGDREVLVRINGLDTRWWVEDIDAAASARPDAVLVPKVSSPRQLQGLGARVADIG